MWHFEECIFNFAVVQRAQKFIYEDTKVIYNGYIKNTERSFSIPTKRLVDDDYFNRVYS